MEKVNIAVVEDHELLRQELCRIVENFGYCVVLQAENGSVALEKLGNINALPDICLLDVSMPVMDGFTTATELRKRFPGMKIMAYSLRDDVHTIIRIFQSGVDGYMVKGNDVPEIKEALDKLCRSGHYISASTEISILNYLKKGIKRERLKGD